MNICGTPILYVSRKYLRKNRIVEEDGRHLWRRELKFFSVLPGKGILCIKPFSGFDMMITYIPSLKLQLVVAIVNILLRLAMHLN